MTISWSAGGPQGVPSGMIPQAVQVPVVTFNGPSAYDLAVDAGFVGTLEEWLTSLEGPPGDVSTVPGPPGDPTTVADGAIPQAKVASLVSDLAGKQPVGSYATAAQGAKADSAVQPAALESAVAAVTPGSIGAQPAGSYATAAQGAKADSATQPAALTSAIAAITPATIGAQPAGSYATAVQGALADTAVQPGSLSAVATTGAYGDLSGKPTLGGAAALAVGTGAGTVAAGDDARLTNSRTPTAHASTHATGGGDVITPAAIGAATAAQGTLAGTAVQPGSLAAVATTGAYSDLTGKPTLGAAASKGVGTTSGDVAAGNDSRLSDARTPTAHASSHAAAGADPVTITEAQVTGLTADLAALSTFRDLRDRMITHSRATGAGQTSLTSVGSGPTGTGTATAATQSWNNIYSAFRRLDYVATAATNAVSGIRCNPMFARGSAGYPSSGWNGKIRGGPAVGLASPTNATNRYFMGLRGSSSAPTDVNPSTLVNIVGVGWDSADTNWQLMHNDGSGTATKTDLGTAHPTVDRVNGATSTGYIYEFESACDPGGTSITWAFRDLIVGTLIGSGTITSADIPAATSALSPYIYGSVGGTSNSSGITFVDYTYETLT